MENNRLTHFPSLRGWLFPLLFVALFLFYLLLGNWAFENGLLLPQTLVRSVQARAVSGSSAISPNYLDFHQPPLSLLLSFVFPENPVLVPSFSGALLVSLLLLYVWRNFQTRPLKFMASFLLVAFPGVLFSILLSQDFVLFLFLFSVSFYFLLEFSVEERVFYLFMFGLLSGFLFLLRFETLFAFAYLVFVFFAFYPPRKAFHYVVSALFPAVFLFLSWLFVVWIFWEPPAHYIQAIWQDFFAASWVRQSSNHLSLFLGLLPFPVWYLFLFFSLGRFPEFFRSPLFLILFFPFPMVFLFLFSGHAFFPSTWPVLFVFHFVLLFPYLGPLFNEKRSTWLHAMVLLFLLGWNFFSFSFSAFPEERAFCTFIRGESFTSPVETYRSLAQKIRSDGVLLLDLQASAAPLFFVSPLPEMFLPGMDEFESALSQPHFFVDQVLVHLPSDGVSQRLDLAWLRQEEGFSVVSQGKDWILWQSSAQK
ncbi:MAG TPA: hypothetical protein P5560_03690 [Thermotogota bacterium]|nr:hypothetical protein [Thermotogota bacterium]